jgi:hypothetical protein
MDRNGRPRRRLESSSIAPTTLTECARRYHGAALALARTFGVPLTADFVRDYHPAISSIYIESGKLGLRLPAGVRLPPLAPAAHAADGHEMMSLSADLPEQPAAHAAPEPEPDRDPRPPGAGEAPPASTTDQAPAPMTIPVDAGLPCGGVAITALKPAQLAMLVSKVAALVHAEGHAWVPLLGSLQAGKRPTRVAVEGDGHGL